jgi:hypothetical protein
MPLKILPSKTPIACSSDEQSSLILIWFGRIISFVISFKPLVHIIWYSYLLPYLY